jgi:site-specific DNA recombinase
MKKADLYIRVSTDEQAEKGYSQRSQAEGLQKYCENHSIEVRKIIFEDHSAKTFMRLSWQKLLFKFKRKRGVTDYILFTKWDRFSVNKNDAPKVKWAFQQIANGVFTTDQIRREINKSGIKCGKNNFQSLLRNTVYFGRINIAKFKDEEGSIIVGQHDPIISENLFYEVQDVLNGRKRNTVPRISCEEMLPLRGFLICPRCGKMLTGSPSKGRNAYYYYYHCNSPCRYRAKALEINERFLCELKRYINCPPRNEISSQILQMYFKDQTIHKKKSSIQISTQIEEINNRFKNELNLFADGKMDQSHYRKLKENYQPILNALERKLMDSKKKQKNIISILKTAIQNMTLLDKIYLEGTIQKKRQIISSMFPEKLCFDEKGSRTGRINEVAQLIHTLNKDFSERQNQKAGKTLPAPDRVTLIGLMSNHFLNDLKPLAMLRP